MTDARLGPFTRAHVVYVSLVGALAIAGLTTAIATRTDIFVGAISRDPDAFVTFLTLGFVTRLLSVRLAGMVTFSLDTGVYVASLMTLGTGPAALIVFLAMLLRGLVDLVNREVAGRDPWPPVVSAAKLIFGPSVTAAIVAGIGLLLEPAALLSEIREEQIFALVLLYVGTMVALVVPQYAVVTVAYYLNKLPWRKVLSEVVVPGFISEAVFIPVGFTLVAVYRGGDLLSLLSLAVSYSVFGEVFRRMWLKSQTAREKAGELAVIEEAGRAAASTLDIEDVGRRIGSILLRVIDAAVGMVFIARSPERGKDFTYVRARDRTAKPAIYQAVLSSLGGHVFMKQDEPDGPPTRPIKKEKGLDIGEIIARPMVGPDGADVGHLSVVFRAGAKPTDRERRIVESIARQAAIAVENWRLYSMATIDGLTGLYIRRYLEARLSEEFERAQRSGAKFCVIMLDVDNLKDINDAYGHAAGDTLLRQVAAALKESVRGMDVAARWGGDEFAVLLPDMDVEAGMAVARRLAAVLRRKTFMVGLERITPSASMGVTVCDGKIPESPAELMAAADRALYQAKKSGRHGDIVAVVPE